MNKITKINKLFIIFLLSFLGLSHYGCEREESDQSEMASSIVNTLQNNTIGSGQAGLVTDYFYNFENNIDASFYRYHPT